MRIIGVSGQLRNGKDTVCDFLLPGLNALGLGKWVRTAFADSLKDNVCRIFGVTREFIERWKTIDQPPQGWNRPVRECLIWLGDGCRSFKSSVWLEKILRQPGNKLVSDCRYMNELHLIHKYGIVIRVIRPGFSNSMANGSESELARWDKDAVEGPVSPANDIPFDYILYNDGTLEELREKIVTDVIPFCEQKLKFFT